MQMQLPAQVHTILDTLAAHGYAAYAVGGCVRDAVMGVVPHDWDICTSARPDALVSCFSRFHTVDTGLRHGTLTVVIDGAPYEITTFRSDGPYSDHRHPDAVSFSDDVVGDLRRRDFTINAMAYAPNAGLIDPFNGAGDIASGVIRCVGDPDARFFEDALRILRALRFASTLGFRLDEATSASIRKNAPSLTQIAAERIHDELDRLLVGGAADEVLGAYPDVIGIFLPEILPCVGFEQRSKYHHLNVWSHTCLAIRNAPADITVRLALLLHDVAKPACFTLGDDGYGHFYGHPQMGAQMARDALVRLRYDAETIAQVACLVRFHDAKLTATKPSARRWLNRIGLDTLQKLLDVKRADASAHSDPNGINAQVCAFERVLGEVLLSRDCFSLCDLAIDGRAVMALGVPEGPAVGRILASLLDEVMDDKLPNERAALLARAEEFARQPI